VNLAPGSRCFFGTVAESRWMMKYPAGQQADVGIGTKGTGPRAGYEEERKIEVD